MTWPDNIPGSASDVPSGQKSGLLGKFIGRFSEDGKENARQSQEAERATGSALKALEARLAQVEARLYDAEQKILAEHP